jgi:hypothetical protein
MRFFLVFFVFSFFINEGICQLRLAEQSNVTPMTYDNNALLGMMILQKQKEEKFNELYEKAMNSWYSSDYYGVIFYYNQTKKLGWRSSGFYEIVGDSFKSLNKIGKAKRFYYKSYKMGNYSAKKKYDSI